MAEDARFFNSGNVMYYPARDVIFITQMCRDDRLPESESDV